MKDYLDLQRRAVEGLAWGGGGCISKSIHAIKMKFIWCMKHSNMFIWQKLCVKDAVITSKGRHTLKKPESWIRHLGFQDFSEMSEKLQI